MCKKSVCVLSLILLCNIILIQNHVVLQISVSLRATSASILLHILMAVRMRRDAIAFDEYAGSIRVKKQVCDLGNKSSGEHVESGDGRRGLIVKFSPSKTPPRIVTGSRFRAQVNCKNDIRSALEKLSRAAQKCCTQALSGDIDSYLVQDRSMPMSRSSTPHTTSRSCVHEKSER